MICLHTKNGCLPVNFVCACVRLRVKQKKIKFKKACIRGVKTQRSQVMFGNAWYKIKV